MPLPDVPDTYRITMLQQMSSKNIVNVFHYRDTSILGPTPLQVATAFWNNAKAAWRGWQVTSAAFLNVSVTVEQLNSGHPFGVYAIPVGEQQGLRASATDFYALTVAGLISLKVGTRVTRPGSKRIAGLVEGDVGGGSTLIAGSVTLLQALADKFKNTWATAGIIANMAPVIVGYPGPRNGYTLQVQDVTDAIASTFVSHQISRDQRP